VPAIRLEQIHEEIAARVAALDATPFLASEASGAWVEAEIPFTAASGSHGRSHLLFAVDFRSVPISGLTRNAPGWEAGVAVDVAVQFLYHLRPTEQGTDQKLSYEAARQVLKTMLAPWADVNVQPTNAYQPGGLLAGEWLPVQVLFRVFADISI